MAAFISYCHHCYVRTKNGEEGYRGEGVGGRVVFKGTMYSALCNGMFNTQKITSMVGKEKKKLNSGNAFCPHGTVTGL